MITRALEAPGHKLAGASIEKSYLELPNSPMSGGFNTVMEGVVGVVAFGLVANPPG